MPKPITPASPSVKILTTREQRDAFVDRGDADDFIADFDLDL